MNIGPNEEKLNRFYDIEPNNITCNDLQTLFDLNLEENMGRLNLMTRIIESSLAIAKRVWVEFPTKLDDYTIHDLRHSKGIIYNLRKDFSNAFKLSNFEIATLISAAFLHDIGMQFLSWEKLLQKEELNLFKDHLYLFTENNGLNQQEIAKRIRENHCSFGFCLISEMIAGKINLHVELDEKIINYMNFISFIAFSHSDNKILMRGFEENIFMNDEREDYHSRLTGIFRKTLLYEIFSLLDLLDDSYERVPNEISFNTPGLKDENKIHWIKCYHLDSYNLKEETNNTKSIKIHWRANRDNAESIKDFLDSFYIREINKQIQSFKEFQSTEFPFPISPTVTLAERFTPIRDITEKSNMEKYITRIIADRRNILSEQVPYHEDIVSEKKPQNKTNTINILQEEISDEKFLNENECVKDLPFKLLSWLDKNILNGEQYNLHFNLSKGEHTSKYIESRLLLTEPQLVNLIIKYITCRYANNNIDTVVGIGSTAIHIASIVSSQLKCKCSYTFFQLNKENKKNYLSYELEMDLFENQNVLFIDDIFSGGDVFNTILSNIKKPLNNIFFQALFVLGNRENVEIQIPFSYSKFQINGISFYNDIAYFSDDPNECKLCKNQYKVIDENEIYSYLVS